MTGQDAADDRLLAELAAALGPPDAPQASVDAARAVFTWRTVDAELAALVHDSALTGLAGAVRGTSATLRSLTFAVDDVVIDVDLDPSGVVGQVVPAQAGRIEVRVEGTVVRTVEVDAVGSFAVRPVPDGPFQLVLDDGARRVVTAWITP